jgi:hypothetical protein
MIQEQHDELRFERRSVLQEHLCLVLVGAAAIPGTVKCIVQLISMPPEVANCSIRCPFGGLLQTIAFSFQILHNIA